MNRSRKTTAAAAVLGAALLAAPAVWLARAEPGRVQGQGQRQARPAGATQAPGVDRPESKPETRPDTGPARRGPAQAQGLPRGLRPIDQPVSPAEWADISEFMAQYMP